MRILAAGGGSGGHVTPVVVVINEIERLKPGTEVLFICDKAFEQQSRGLMGENTSLRVQIKTITAGKFRRYKHLTMLRQLVMPRIVLANFRDVFKVFIGFVQSVIILVRFKPDVVFAKGGFVCLPVGMAAHVLGVPIVVHDSDTRPGLTNSVLGRWATRIATGSPLDNYKYPHQISRYVGVPIAAEFHRYSEYDQQEAKRKLGVDVSAVLVVATGGGLGATSINTAILQASPRLLEDGICLYHITGKKHYQTISKEAPKHDNYQMTPFVYSQMATVLGAADIVVSRASATFIQELAGLGQAAILIPSKALGDQQKNAQVYRDAEAAIVLSDDELSEPGRLYDTIRDLIDHPEKRELIANNLHDFSRPHAAEDVARMIIDTAKK